MKKIALENQSGSETRLGHVSGTDEQTGLGDGQTHKTQLLTRTGQMIDQS